MARERQQRLANVVARELLALQDQHPKTLLGQQSGRGGTGWPGPKN
jgi:hypothetical protein